MPTLDFATLHWCSIVTSLTFGVLFAYDWLIRDRARHLLLAGASYVTYAASLAGLGFLGGGTIVRALLCGSLGLNTMLILMAVRCFDGRRRLEAWVLAIPVATTLAYLLPALLPNGWLPVASHLAAEVTHSLALAAATTLAAAAILRRRRTSAPRAQTVVAVTLLAYLPGYAVSGILALQGGTEGHVLALIPMLSDQVLLPVLGLGLLGMVPERDARALRRAALRDPLTGAWNRAGLPRLERRAPGDAAVVLIDVDRFKAINDRYGHAAGDAVLVALADGARAAGLPGCALVRLGGDEFLAVCPSLDAAHALANTILALGRDASPCWSASIGVAVRAPGETSLEPAIARADMLLYRAKSGGRGRLAA